MSSVICRANKDGRPISVEKEISLDHDLGYLTSIDMNGIDPKRHMDEEYLMAVARDDTQLLMNEILGLPRRKGTDGSGIIIQLPPPSTLLPREKPLPKPRGMTKWQEFAEKKGISTKRKTGQLVWDEETKDWVPRWGPRSKNNREPWVMEVAADGKEEDVDVRAKLKATRTEGIRKNEQHRMANLARQEGDSAVPVKNQGRSTTMPSLQETRQKLQKVLPPSMAKQVGKKAKVHRSRRNK